MMYHLLVLRGLSLVRNVAQERSFVVFFYFTCFASFYITHTRTYFTHIPLYRKETNMDCTYLVGIPQTPGGLNHPDPFYAF